MRPALERPPTAVVTGDAYRSEMAKDYYTTAERRHYKSPPCVTCGGRTIQQWIDVSGYASREQRWIPGSYRCANRQCFST